jgi:hypothetical protein
MFDELSGKPESCYECYRMTPDSRLQPIMVNKILKIIHNALILGGRGEEVFRFALGVLFAFLISAFVPHISSILSTFKLD